MISSICARLESSVALEPVTFSIAASCSTLSIGTTSVSSPSADMPELIEERSWSVPSRPVAVASPPTISSICAFLMLSVSLEPSTFSICAA